MPECTPAWTRCPSATAAAASGRHAPSLRCNAYLHVLAVHRSLPVHRMDRLHIKAQACPRHHRAALRCSVGRCRRCCWDSSCPAHPADHAPWENVDLRAGLWSDSNESQGMDWDDWSDRSDSDRSIGQWQIEGLIRETLGHPDGVWMVSGEEIGWEARAELEQYLREEAGSICLCCANRGMYRGA